ncbi:hypothetical protein [Maricaulis sp.]
MTDNPDNDPQGLEAARAAATAFFKDTYQTLVDEGQVVLPYEMAIAGVEMGVDDDGSPQLVVLLPENLNWHMRGWWTEVSKFPFPIYDEGGTPSASTRSHVEVMIFDRDRIWRKIGPDAPPIKFDGTYFDRRRAVLRYRERLGILDSDASMEQFHRQLARRFPSPTPRYPTPVIAARSSSFPD